MKLLNYRPAVLLLALFAGACTKKAFTPMKEPAVLIDLRAKPKQVEPVKFIQEPFKEGHVEWRESMVNFVELEGVLRVTNKDADLLLWQATCPKELACNGAKIYLPLNATLEYDAAQMPFGKEIVRRNEKAHLFVAKKSESADVIKTRNFFDGAYGERPTKFMPELMRFFLPENDGEFDLIARRFLEPYLYSIYATEDKETPGLTRYLHCAASNALKAATRRPEDIPKPDDFIKNFRAYTEKQFDKYLKSKVDNFPLVGMGFVSLAENIDRNCIPGRNEKIFLRLLEEKSIAMRPVDKSTSNNPIDTLRKIAGVEDPAFIPSLTFVHERIEVGMIAQLKTPTETYEFYVSYIDARPKQLGLRFILGLKPKGDVTLKHVEALAAAAKTERDAAETGQKAPPVTDFSSLTIDYEPVKDSDYLNIHKHLEKEAATLIKKTGEADFSGKLTSRSLQLLALKYGEGKLDKTTGLYSYVVTLQAPEPYHTFAKMVRYSASGRASVGVSEGAMHESFEDGRTGYGPGVKLRWHDAASSFYLEGSQEVYHRTGSFTSAVKGVCFKIGDRFALKFEPAELINAEPDIFVKYATEPGPFCSILLFPAKVREMPKER